MDNAINANAAAPTFVYSTEGTRLEVVTVREALQRAGFGMLDAGRHADTLVGYTSSARVPVNADGRLWLRCGGGAVLRAFPFVDVTPARTFVWGSLYVVCDGRHITLEVAG